jgi:DNA-binding HxlR family transcriptional regulator
MVRSEFNLHGFHNRDLRSHLPAKNSGQISRLLKRLRLHGLIKKVSQNYKYYLTSFGKQILTAGLKLRNLVLIPQLALSATVS